MENNCCTCGSSRAPLSVVGGRVCGPCYERLPYCPTCSRITAALQARDHVLHCRACNRAVFRCCICHTFETPRKFRVLRDGFACETCYADAVFCRWCRVYKPRAVCDIVEGYRCCQDCQKHAPLEEADLEPLHAEAAAIVEQHLGLEVKQPYTLKPLRTWEKLTREWHLPEYNSGDFIGLWRPSERQMWLQLGMPRWETLLVLCHEITHAWQTENCPERADAMAEGFALWVELKLVDVVAPHGEAARYMRDEWGSRNVYTKGARRLLLLEDQLGIPGVIQYARENGDFPISITLDESIDALTRRLGLAA